MRKRTHLLVVSAMLTILTACGADKDYTAWAGTEMPEPEVAMEESDLGTEMPWYDTAIEEPDSEAETPEDEAEIEEPDWKTTEDGECAAFPERAYETDIIYYNEPSGGVHLRKDVEKTQTDYATYYFEIPISEQERNACIAATDRMLSRIDAPLPELEVVVLQQKSYNGVSVSGDRLYLSPQPWDSLDYLARELLAGYGEWANYGLAYGYANHLCNKAGLDGGEAGADGREADSLLPMSVLELYDLNLLCFDEKFASPQDVEAAKNNACLFVEDYLSSHSEEEFLELLSASGTVEGVAWSNEALETFYAENGVECSLTGILYQPGGASADYAAACEYARFYVYRDWQDVAWRKNPSVSENFLHEDYGEVRAFFECNAYQMRQYQEFFGFDSYNNALSVFLKNHKVASAPSCYVGKHEIYLENVGSLMHEYIHSVMFGHEAWEESWKIEGFARYFSYKDNLYNSLYMYDYLNAVWNNSASSSKYVQEYIDMVGRPIDIRTDFRELENIVTYACGETDPNASYQSGSSFIGYLSDLYGEEAVIAYVCSDDEYNAEWDKSYHELVWEWRKYIRDNYSQYSTIEMQ